MPETLTHGRFVYLANRACRRFEHRVSRHQPVKSNDPFQKYLNALAYLKHVAMPGYDRLLFELHGLAPPPADAVAFRRMLATFNYTDLVIHHFFQATDELQKTRLKTLSRRLDRLSKRIHNRAGKVGLHSCAKV